MSSSSNTPSTSKNSISEPSKLESAGVESAGVESAGIESGSAGVESAGIESAGPADKPSRPAKQRRPEVSRVEGDGFLLRPIGVVRSPYTELAQAPRQARAAEETRARIELVRGLGLEEAVRDLEGWDYVWILTFMDRARTWRPKVLPPRSEIKRGVFATRAPHRPNPIGLTPMRLLSVSARTLEVAECDIVDGTPVLDIKPYVPWADAIPGARTGWLTPPDGALPGGERPADPRPTWNVVFEPRAQRDLEWLRNERIELEERIRYALSLGPQPHAYRRIAHDERGWRIAVKEWHARFRVESETIVVTHLESGIPVDSLDQFDPVHVRFGQRPGRG